MPAIDRADTVMFNARRLLEAAQAFSVPILVSEQYPQGLGPTVAPVAEAIPEGTPIIAKKSFSVCGSEELRKRIEEQDVPKVILSGVETHICILQSVFDLLTLGREVVLAVDAIGSRSRLDDEIALRRMEAHGVTLATTESILFEWCGSADHAQFKTISNLAKRKPC